ncbi:MAG TPA: MotA/TolQ/ExbB proton channel family protein [Tepidisphaeraceae bacterium]|nr:MotA/TolQ/ExbB proton channel family protein [Tepidisphaeraceae bacterium]
MRRRYATSKFRVALMLGMIAAVVFVATSDGFAQPAGGGTAAPPQKQNIFQLIIGHIDFVSVTIALLSVVALTLIIQGFIKVRQSVLMPEASVNHIRELIGRREFKELIEYTETDPSFVSRALNPALKRAPSFSSMKEAMETAIAEQTADQFRKIEYLNIIGNLGPLLGLLGTVLGMIEAFQDLMAAGGDANPSKLAGGISTALCHTFLGLFLAVPCLAVFGILRTMVDRITIQAALVSEELLLLIKPAEAKPAAAGAVAAPRPGVAAPVPGAVRKAPVPVPPTVP